MLVGTIAAQNNFDDKWITWFEKSDYLESPPYEETIEYFDQFVNEFDIVKKERIGITPQGREMYVYIVAKGKEFTPGQARANGKAVVYVENGIHSGEIEGKEACMLLLREILVTKEKEHLLDNVVLVILPVFNIDGHERSGKYNRINQNGPTYMGWRTTAQNLNLNRDWGKTDAPEMQAVVKLFAEWLPDMFIDTHTTNGADYQYTMTYITEQHENVPPQTRKWVKETFMPAFIKHTESEGYLVGPYVYFREEQEKKSIRGFVTPPRLATGYVAAQNRVGITTETHMLKPFKDRVFATKAMIESITELVNTQHEDVIAMNEAADEYVMKHYLSGGNEYPITFDVSDKYDNLKFKGKKAEFYDSWITGDSVVNYLDENYEFDMPYYNYPVVQDEIRAPKGYIIPQEWKLIADRMKLHGIEVKQLDNADEFVVERIRFKDVSFAETPYEGRIMPEYEYDVETDTVTANIGDYYVDTNQRTLQLILQLLEPKGIDSFVKWGFFNAIFERKEYFEFYSMEPIAQQMAEDNPELKEEFMKKLEEDEEFAKSPWMRLNFWYKHSKYYDKKHNVYPVLRVM